MCSRARAKISGLLRRIRGMEDEMAKLKCNKRQLVKLVIVLSILFIIFCYI